MDECKVVMLIGLSGAGKSTKAKELSKRYSAEILATDELREEIFGDYNIQTENEKVFRELYSRLRLNIKNNKNTILDSTNLSLKDRMKFFQAIHNYDCYKIAYIIATPFDVCLENNNKRERFVPENVIHNQRNKFCIPFKEEGFSEVIIDYYNIINLKGHTEYLGEMDGFDQKTKWHKYDLLTHCIKIYEELIKNECQDEILQMSAFYHDYAKIKCQTFKENSDNANYYNHENIGAYELMCDLPKEIKLHLNEDQILNFLFYVNYHMRPFSFKNQKTHDKYKKIFGEEKYNNLILFNECDQIASGGN